MASNQVTVRGRIEGAQRCGAPGAGIFTDSGIPDFGGTQGLWMKNPGAEKLSDIRYYMSDPEVRRLSWQPPRAPGCPAHQCLGVERGMTVDACLLAHRAVDGAGGGVYAC